MKHLVATTLLLACVAVTQVAVAQEASQKVSPSVSLDSTSAATVSSATPAEASSAAAAEIPATTTAPANVIVTPAVTAAGIPAAVARAANIPDLSTAYEIGPEDVLDISVWKNPELSRTVPVRPDGKVSLPLVNDIQAAGLSPSDLRDQVTARLSEFVPAPEVSVIVREVHSRKVAVVGAVKTPGRYELRSSMTVLEVLALAQGLTDFAARDKIVVLRQVGGKTTRIPFNYRKIADSAEQDNFLIRPGDIVVVP